MVYRAFIIPLMLFHAYKLLHIDYKHKSLIQISNNMWQTVTYIGVRMYVQSCNIFYGQLAQL